MAVAAAPERLLSCFTCICSRVRHACLHSRSIWDFGHRLAVALTERRSAAGAARKAFVNDWSRRTGGLDPALTVSAAGPSGSPVAINGLSFRAVIARRAASLTSALLWALDLGNNNCRLPVARALRAGSHSSNAISRIIRLGGGDIGVRTAHDDARHRRAVEALGICPLQDDKKQPRRHARRG